MNGFHDTFIHIYDIDELHIVHLEPQNFLEPIYFSPKELLHITG